MKQCVSLLLALCLLFALAAPAWAEPVVWTEADSPKTTSELLDAGEVEIRGTVTVTSNSWSTSASLSILLNGTMVMEEADGISPFFRIVKLSIDGSGGPKGQGVIINGAIRASTEMSLCNVQIQGTVASSEDPVYLEIGATLTLSGKVTVIRNQQTDGTERNIYLAKGAKIKVAEGFSLDSRIGVTLAPDYAEGNENAAFIVDENGNPLTAAQLGNCFYQDGDPDTPITSGQLKGGAIQTQPPQPPSPPPTPDTAVALDKTELSLEPGQTAKLKASLTPADATYKYIFWESSDEAVATVSDSGLVTAIADGTATITAKSWYGHEAVCTVTVKTPDQPEPPTPVDPWPAEGLAGFVTRCYRVALGRDPDQAGHADWVRWLKDGTVDATSCTSGFVFSKEMNNKNLSEEAFVKTLYNLFMDRDGEPTGVAFWTEYLQAGHSREEVFYGFADSVEFARIKTSYGLG